jgi:Kelch motif protein/galactose oxidase-like protein
MTDKKTRLLMGFVVLLWMFTAAASGQMIGRNLASHKGFRPAAAGNDVAAPAGSRKWTLLFPTHILDERFAAAAVYDAPTNSLIVFSGSSLFDVPNDVMSLSNANGIGTPNWTTAIPSGAPGSPVGRTFHTAVYDAANSRMIVFGGCAFTGDLCTNLLNDVWVLTNANGLSGTPTWVQLTPAGSPPPRWGHAAAYDPVNNRMIVYGGDNGSVVFSDAWVLSNANGVGGSPTWTQLIPSGGPPEGQDSPSVVYDPATNILVEFAGAAQNFGHDTNSVWTLSNANGVGGAPVWKKILANGSAGSPPKRDGFVSAYDSANNRMVVFGGNADTPSGFPSLNDVWVLANANGVSGTPQWTKIAASGTKPGGRTSPVGGYDSANNRLIVYGGGSWDADFFSTWVLTGANGLQ